jgi:hypothetical protein
MVESGKSKTGVYIGLGVFLATGLLAAAVIFRGEPPPPPGTVVKGTPTNAEPTLPPSALLAQELARREEEEVAARRAASGDRMMIQQDQMVSDLLQRGRQPVGQRGAVSEEEAPAPGAADPGSERIDAARATYTPAGDSPEGWSVIKLDGREEGILNRLGANVKSPNDAYKLGADNTMFGKLMAKLGKHPKISKYLLDNEFVVKGFMSSPMARRNCTDPKAAASYFQDGSSSKGSKRTLGPLNAFLKGSSESPTVLGSSKMMGAIMKCPAFNMVINDPKAVGGIIEKNPLAAQMLQDPAILKGMTASPQLLSAYAGAQAGLSGK